MLLNCKYLEECNVDLICIAITYSDLLETLSWNPCSIWPLIYLHQTYALDVGCGVSFTDIAESARPEFLARWSVIIAGIMEESWSHLVPGNPGISDSAEPSRSYTGDEAIRGRGQIHHVARTEHMVLGIGSRVKRCGPWPLSSLSG
jgi:hypothetical protein